MSEKLENKSLPTDVQAINEDCWRSIYERYKLKAMNRYVWKGLPKNVHSHRIEEILFYSDVVAFSKDEERGYLILNGNIWNFLDINNRPTECSIVGQAYVKQKHVYYGEDCDLTIIGEKPYYDEYNSCVLIKNNETYTSTYTLIKYKMFKLYNIEREIDRHLEQLGLQNIIVADTQDRANLNSLEKKIKDKKSLIFICSNGLKQKPENLSLAIDFKGKELYDLKKAVENEIDTILGLNNVDFEKKERLLEDEVNANNENIENELDIGLKCRQRACEYINKLFNLNVSVEVNTDIKESENDDISRMDNTKPNNME